MSTQRHARIAKLQAKILGGIVGVVLAVTTAFGLVQTSHNSDAADKAQVASVRADFWQVVAGKQDPKGASSINKFASALRDSLGTTDASATVLPSAIEQFAAGPNDYPGIVNDLGLEPFNSQGLSCTSCGPLNVYMKNRLLTIKQGGITQLLADELASAPKVEGLTLTPLGMPGILWFGFVYLAGTTVALMFAVRIDAKRNDYHRVMLDWKQDGGSSADPYKIISKSLAFPHFWIILKLDEKFGKNKEAILREMNLAEEGETLSELFKQLEALPAGRQRDELKATLDELRGGIDEQVANYLGSNRDYKQMEASALAERISTTARAVSDRLEARNASRRELEQGSSDSLQEVMDEIERASGANKPDAIRERRQR